MTRGVGWEIILGLNHMGEQVMNTPKWFPILGDEIFP
jgi:hypothetical protein